MILDLGTGSDPMGFLRENRVRICCIIFTMVKMTFKGCENLHHIKELWHSSRLYVRLGNESGYAISIFSYILPISSQESERRSLLNNNWALEGLQPGCRFSGILTCLRSQHRTIAVAIHTSAKLHQTGGRTETHELWRNGEITDIIRFLKKFIWYERFS